MYTGGCWYYIPHLRFHLASIGSRFKCAPVFVCVRFIITTFVGLKFQPKSTHNHIMSFSCRNAKRFTYTRCVRLRERERKPPCQVNDSRFATLKTFWSKLGFFHCHSVPALLLANQAKRCVWCTPLMECWPTIAFHPFYSFARRRSLFLKLILKWCLTPFVYIKLLVRLHARQLTGGKNYTLDTYVRM